MSVKVDLDQLDDALADFTFAYLITVGDDYRAHTVAVQPVLVDGVLDVGAIGKSTRSNAGAHPGVTAYGPVILTFAWLATADKADSSQARAWRGSAFAALGAAASIAFASVFLFANERTAPISIMILVVTVVQAAALWAPIDWWGRRLLSRVASTMTSRHLERRTRAYAPVYLAWEEQQEAVDDALSPLQRLFRRRR